MQGPLLFSAFSEHTFDGNYGTMPPGNILGHGKILGAVRISQVRSTKHECNAHVPSVLAENFTWECYGWDDGSFSLGVEDVSEGRECGELTKWLWTVATRRATWSPTGQPDLRRCKLYSRWSRTSSRTNIQIRACYGNWRWKRGGDAESCREPRPALARELFLSNPDSFSRCVACCQEALTPSQHHVMHCRRVEIRKSEPSFEKITIREALFPG